MARLNFIFISIALIGLASSSAAQVHWPRNQHQQPRVYPQQRVHPNGQQWPVQSSQYQQRQQEESTGTTTQVLPDGRIITRVPFSEEQKRQIAEREATRARLKTVRERELDQQGKNDSLYPRLPAEFEKQKAILLSLADWQPHNLGVLVELIEKTRGHVNLLILHNEKNSDDEKISN